MALAPGLLGAVVLLAGLALLDSEAFLVIRYAVAILAAVVVVFAVQAKAWGWAVPPAAIVVVWNPVYPLDLSGQIWVAAQFVAALAFVVVGLRVRRRVTDAGSTGNRR